MSNDETNTDKYGLQIDSNETITMHPLIYRGICRLLEHMQECEYNILNLNDDVEKIQNLMKKSRDTCYNAR